MGTLSTISMGLTLDYLPPPRDLIQINKGNAHIDLWLYTLDTSTMIMSNYDYTTKVFELDYNKYFPSKYMKWQHIDVPMPKNEQYAAQLEFGNDYMTPQYHQFQCLENIVTNKISKCRWTVYIIILISANLIAMLIRKILTNREYRRKFRRNANSIILAAVPSNVGVKLRRMMDSIDYVKDSGDFDEVDEMERAGLLDATSEDEYDE